MRIVLVGFGPVGVRFAEELLPKIRAGLVDLTIVSAETDEPYNRVMIAEYGVGEVTRDELAIADRAEFVEAGATVLVGRRVERIDREAAVVALDDGRELAFDRVVLATGARANVPVLDGLEARASRALDRYLTAGVCVLRDLEDAERLHEVVAAGGRIVVLGAGVLGVELALLLVAAGAVPTMAHFGPIPMPRQLDRGSARVVTAAMEAAGVTVVPHTRAEAIITTEVDGRRVFRALVSGDGKRFDGDLLVLSCGVTARTELAEQAGLRVGHGVLVDERLRSWSDERIHAIGDCAHVADPAANAHEREVPGGPSGLIGPGWRQAEWLAESITAELDAESDGSADPTPEAFVPFAEEVPGIVVVKAAQLDLVSAGDVSADPFSSVPGDPEVAVWADPQHGSYAKMITRDGVLTGFVAVGMARTAAELSVLHQRRGELPADRSLLLRLDAAEDGAPRTEGRDAMVCICNAVTAGGIEDAVAAGGCATVEEVGRCTRAGTGCGGCRARIGEMLTRLEAAPL